MALTTSTITGRVPLPSDENLQFAELTFALSGLDTEGASVLPGGVSTRAVLIGSDIPAGFELWQNTAGLRGTHYRVLARWTVKDRDGIRDQYADLGIVQVGSDASYTLAALLNYAVPSAPASFWSSITQAEYDAVMQARDDAAASAVAAALYDGPRVDTVPELATLTPLAVSPGDYVQVVTDGPYRVVATGGDVDHTGSGGVRLDRLSRVRATVGDTYVDVVDAFDLRGGYDLGDSAKIQRALDEAAIGSILKFRSKYSFLTTTGLEMNRLMHLDLDGANIAGVFAGGDGGSDVLRVSITDVGAGAMVGDVRNLRISGGQISGTNGNCAININPNGDGTEMPHFQTIVSGAIIGGHLRGVRIGKANMAGDTNFCTIQDCNLSANATAGAEAAVSLDGCADGHRIINNLIFGEGYAVRTNLINGAYQTKISGNGLVTRQGAWLNANGSNVMFTNNQCEHPTPSAAPIGTILNQSLLYKSIGCIISGNNFGGGGNALYSLYIDGVEQWFIDNNQFYLPASGQDIYLGPTSHYNTIGANNIIRGARGVQVATATLGTDITRRLRIDIDAAAKGNRGVWRGAGALGLANGWASSGFEAMLTPDGDIKFAGTLSGGTVTAGTVMATLPVGMRPPGFNVIPFCANNIAFSAVSISAGGDISVATIPASPDDTAYFAHMSIRAAMLDGYDVGA